jgi:hypothetical protein
MVIGLTGFLGLARRGDDVGNLMQAVPFTPGRLLAVLGADLYSPVESACAGQRGRRVPMGLRLADGGGQRWPRSRVSPTARRPPTSTVAHKPNVMS